MKTSKMKFTMVLVAILSVILTVATFILYKIFGNNILKVFYITFLTISFHFVIRLVIGNVLPLFKQKINVGSNYFKLSPFENKLYKALKVKKWKKHAPTYDSKEFDITKNSLDELILNTCNSEIIHTINVVISYLPLLFIIIYGTPLAFIITSIIASLFDLQFVIIQRYNRDRLIKINSKK